MISSLRNRVGNAVAAMTNVILTWLRNGKPVSFTREEYRHCVFSFSQFGEDLLVRDILTGYGTIQGIYVDVGAYHPQMFSNTLLLHKAGYRGVNIDMNPHKVRMFERDRPGDWNVCAAVSDGEYAFETVHTGETTEAIELIHADEASPRTVTLASILEASPYAGRAIDYLNIDCEGHDLAVLRSIPLDTYRPKVITIEALCPRSGDETRRYLEAANYEFRAIACLTSVFVRRQAT